MRPYFFRIIASLSAVYIICLLVLIVAQRRLMYFPDVARGTVEDAADVGARMLTITTTDGERLVAWYRAPVASKFLFLYFHGNAGNLEGRSDFLTSLSADGSGFLAIDYRGYGGSTGSPSEQGLLDDGETAYREARSLVSNPARIVILGESLGTAIAVSVAAAHPAKALVLDSGFSATVDVAASFYRVFPVRLLMRDTFQSRERIGRVAMPKLFLHNREDSIVPITFARMLYDRAKDPKTFIETDHGGHMVLWSPKGMAAMKDWLRTLP